MYFSPQHSFSTIAVNLSKRMLLVDNQRRTVKGCFRAEDNADIRQMTPRQDGS